MGIIEKIKEIEAEMARTQKNKATGFVSIIIFLKNLLVFSFWFE
jgi:ribosome-interacting GTPase 1